MDGVQYQKKFLYIYIFPYLSMVHICSTKLSISTTLKYIVLTLELLKLSI